MHGSGTSRKAADTKADTPDIATYASGPLVVSICVSAVACFTGVQITNITRGFSATSPSMYVPVSRALLIDARACGSGQ